MKHPLFITQNCKISRQLNQLLIEQESDKKRVPISVIESIFIFGNSNISNSAQNMLLYNNIDIYYLSSNGKLKGVLTNTTLRSNYLLRLRQYEAMKNSLELAKFIVFKKINSIESQFDFKFENSKAKLYEAKNLNEILGIEGNVSKSMFEVVRERLNQNGIKFERREYHPSKDYVNALFSFVYVSYYSTLYSFLLSKGYDPYIGFLHQKRGTFAPFVSDVMEFRRVKLTLFAVDLLIEQVVKESDFDKKFYLNERIKDVILHFKKSILTEENKRELILFLDELNRLI